MERKFRIFEKVVISSRNQNFLPRLNIHSMPHTYLWIPGLFFFTHMATGMAFLMLALYFFPTIIALIRRKPNAGAILVLNFFLGWTFIGWIVALVWAVSGNPEPQQVIINNHMPAERQVTPVIVKTTTTGRPQPPASSAIQPDKISQLRQLKELMDSGILTEEEFNQQKTKILAS
jgi:hypothetical protein